MSDTALPSIADDMTLLDVARDAAAPILARQFQEAVRQSGKGARELVSAFAKLAAGPGRISFADFLKLRLFDERFHEGAARGTFVGNRRNLNFCATVNYRSDYFGLLDNKVAALSYLTAYGLPTLPILAIFAPGLRSREARVLGDREALARFLGEPSRYPLFGKPVESCQSLGSVGLRRLHAETGSVERLDGKTSSVDSLAAEIATHYPTGYLLQSMAMPHPEIEKLCGPRLATVRILTLLTEEGPKIARAAWKIPTGGHAADNFWRPGNLLAALDLGSGRVRRAVSGAGLEGRDVASHPDSGLMLPDLPHPEWPAMMQLALDGAHLMQHTPMIGWDIACTVAGPTIVEMNELPDFFLVQYAEGRGMLDDDFSRFVAFQRKEAAAERATRKAIAKKA